MQRKLLRRKSVRSAAIKPVKFTPETAINFLNSRLSAKFFGSLPVLDVSGRVRLLRFGPLELAIKDTQRQADHGFYYKRLRRDFLLHQRAVRAGSLKSGRYILKSIKVHGRIGKYLVMSRIKPIEIYELPQSVRENFL